MWKSSLALLLLVPCHAPALINDASITNPDAFVRSRAKPKQVDRQVWKREVTASIAMLEALNAQLKAASLSESAEVWDSGTRDFGLKKDVVEKTRQAALLLDRAAAAAAEPLSKSAKVDGLVQDAREKIKGFHKGARENFLLEYRNWLMVSEGSLRKARVKEAAAKGPGPAEEPKK